MANFEFTWGSAPAWYSTVLPPLCTMVAALGAVYLGNMNARRLRQDEVAERKETHDRDRGLAALQLADHLEDFVVHCIEVVSSQPHVDWRTPYEYEDEYGGTTPTWLGELPPWPEHIDWRLIGFDLAVEASNFRRRALFNQNMIGGYAEHADTEDVHAYSADMAAELGKEAWAIARKVRVGGGLAAFEWPEGASDIESLEAYQTRRAEIEASRADALKIDPDKVF